MYVWHRPQITTLKSKRNVNVCALVLLQPGKSHSSSQVICSNNMRYNNVFYSTVVITTTTTSWMKINWEWVTIVKFLCLGGKGSRVEACISGRNETGIKMFLLCFVTSISKLPCDAFLLDKNHLIAPDLWGWWWWWERQCEN